MKRISFTLIEVLLAMAIVGVIAGATANSLKNVSANKVKVAFQNNYNHMQSTMDRIFSDENILPATYFSSSYDSAGKAVRNPLCQWTYKINSAGESVEDFSVIPEAFMDLTAGVLNSKVISGTGVGYAFETKNGSYWVVRKNPQNTTCNPDDVTDISKTDYIILFDVDGIYSGSNCPYNLSATNAGVTGSNCKNPDTFKFGTVTSYKLIPDTNAYYNGKKLETYMEENNFIQTKF